MNTQYADAVNKLTDEVNEAIARTQGFYQISNQEVAKELRQIADQLDNEED